MWFKNIHYYQCLESIPYDPEALVNQLEAYAFQPCGKVLSLSFGWVPPMLNEPEASLVYAANGLLLICLQIEEKVIPATVVREQLEQRVQALEQQQHRKIGKREKQALKDDVHHQLVTQAFSKHARTYAYIDTIHNYLVVDAATPKRADQITELLRKSLGACQLAIADATALPTLMTHWLQHELSQPFELSNACVMQNKQDEKATIRCQRQDLASPNVQGFIKEGSQVIQLALKWQEHLEFVLKQDFSLSQLRFLETVQEAVTHSTHETPAERFDADFVLMTETLRLFFADLLKLVEFKPKSVDTYSKQKTEKLPI